MLLCVCCVIISSFGQDRFDDWPWRLARVADARLSTAERLATAAKFLAASPCCLDEWFGRRLRSMGLVAQPADLLSPAFQAFLRSWCERVVLSNCQVEFRHARHKHLAPSKQHGWVDFSTRCLVAEAQEIHAQEQHLMAEQAKQGSAAAISSVPSLASGPASTSSAPLKLPRPKSALHFYRERLIAEHSAIGDHRNWVTAESWHFVKARWSDLSADDPSGLLA
jgi:hypothetical protein